MTLAIDVLVGLALWDSGTAGLPWFAFGARRRIVTARNTPHLILAGKPPPN